MKEKTKKLVEAFGFLKMDEAQLLMEAADSLAAGSIVVNVGAGAGTSALAIIEQRPDLAVTFYTVDMRDDDNPFGGMLNELHAFQNAKMEHLLPNQIKGDSSTVGNEWDKGEIAFLIIDADHTTDGLTKDIQSWLPHLAIGGLVALHDYKRDVWPDVAAVIDNTLMKDANYEYIETRDTMVLFRKLEPQPLQMPEPEQESIYRKADERTADIEPEQVQEETATEEVAEKKVSKRRKNTKVAVEDSAKE